MSCFFPLITPWLVRISPLRRRDRGEQPQDVTAK